MWGTMHRMLCVLALVAACGDNHEGNTAPTVASLSFSVDEDQPLVRTIDITDNEGDPWTLAFSEPLHGSVTMFGADAFQYRPAPDYNGADSFTVTVSDGRLEASATIDIAVGAVNDAPTGASDAFATAEDTPFITPASVLLANDHDPDGDELAIIAVGQGVSGFPTLIGDTVTFTPFQEFSGGASFSYTLSDGQTTSMVTVEVAVAGFNDPPVAIDDFWDGYADMPLEILVGNLTFNDFDNDSQTLTVTAVGGATHGTVVLVGDTVTFTPAPGFTGQATFDYTVSDGDKTAVGTVFMTFSVMLVAVDDTVTTVENTPVTVTQATMTANDSGGTGPLMVLSASNPVNGSISFAGGNVVFTPTTGFQGTGSFDYLVSAGLDIAEATVFVTVGPP